MNMLKPSLDSRILKWGGAILFAFIGAAFAANLAHARTAPAEHCYHRTPPAEARPS